jgi:hypothetical protein
MTYHFKTQPNPTSEKQIYTASGGSGEATIDELIVSSPQHTFIHKFADGGWYRRNQVTKQDHFLGIGACPTLELADIRILDKKYFDEITYDPNEDNENVGT